MKFGDMSEIMKKAIFLLLIFGVISLLGDVIYEGARSVNGPYLDTLGVNASLVGLIVGIGELLGYAIRLVSGYFADRTRAYWFFTILGYGMLISIPLLAFSYIWQFAAILIILERIGKGIRGPARDTIVSHAAKHIGTGFGFGISEFLDQIGAFIGPMIFTVFFILLGPGDKLAGDYRRGYALFWFPFIILIMILFFAFRKVKEPEALERSEKKSGKTSIPRIFWYYSTFSFVTTMGFVNFAIIGYHLKITGTLSDAQIPLLYGVAMIVDALFGIVIGRIYDKAKRRYKKESSGLLTLIIVPVITALLLPFLFSEIFITILVGTFLWGMVMGAHETVMKAAVADLTDVTKRGTAYGAFNVIYGFALFTGSLIAGFLYEISVTIMISIMIIIQAVSVILYFKMKSEIGT
jgi:MFS family permease